MDWKNADLFILFTDDGEYGFNEAISVFKDLQSVTNEIIKIYAKDGNDKDIEEIVYEEEPYRSYWESIHEIHVKIKRSWGISSPIYALGFVKFSEGNNIIRSWNIREEP